MKELTPSDTLKWFHISPLGMSSQVAVEGWLRLFPPPTTYHVPHTTYKALTTYVFSNIPAFDA